MINKVSCNGRLVDDPELRYSPNGTAVCTLTIAVERSHKNKDGDYEADFPDCVAFKGRAEWIAQNVEKGELVGIGGRIQTRIYENDGGYTNKSTEIVIDDFQKIEWDTKSNNGGSNADRKRDEQEDIDVPF